jgi:hypothetical protein
MGKTTVPKNIEGNKWTGIYANEYKESEINNFYRGKINVNGFIHIHITVNIV